MAKERNPFVKDIVKLVVLFIFSYLLISRGLLLPAVPLVLVGLYIVGIDFYVLYRHFLGENDGEE